MAKDQASESATGQNIGRQKTLALRRKPKQLLRAGTRGRDGMGMSDGSITAADARDATIETEL